jgi:hypothetical protein
MTSAHHLRSDVRPGRSGTGRSLAGRSITGRRAAAITLAAAGGLLIWAVADPVAGLDLTVGAGSDARQVGPGAVVTVAVVAGLAAAGLAVLLSRTAHPRRNWLSAAVAVLIVSLAGPLGAATSQIAVVLAAMHVVVGATLILGIGSTVPRSTHLVPETLER